MLPCLNKVLFGFPCPGCGGQRAAMLLVHGEFDQAFWMYPAIYPLLILGIFMLLQRFFPKKHYQKPVSIFAILSVSVIVLSYSYKMINFF